VSAKTIRLAQAFAFRHNCLCCVLEQLFVPDAAKVWFDVGFSDATRCVFGDAERCLASEKRSSRKSRGWAWWVVCCYGDLGGGLASDPI